MADQLASVLARAEDGVSRTEINKLMGGHRKAGEIEAALARLEANDSARADVATGGTARGALACDLIRFVRFFRGASKVGRLSPARGPASDPLRNKRRKRKKTVGRYSNP